LSAGRSAFVSRVDDLFVSGGENLFPSEAEAAAETGPDMATAL
jgi:hypothetical protein